MQLFISIKNAITLPNRDEIKKAMWEKAISVSHAFDLKEFNSLMLSWDKWIDDTRWSDGIPKSFEHINFEFRNKKLIIVDVDDKGLTPVCETGIKTPCKFKQPVVDIVSATGYLISFEYELSYNS